ncbi:MAG: hypothetical protein SFZ24_12110 [Planctomycetota bacterium]|nr:hypothetical protein [Planctomycetota bacterium]
MNAASPGAMGTSSAVRDRALIIIPIVHAEADLGTLAAEVRGADPAAWERKQRLIGEHWNSVERFCSTLPGEPRRWRVYQDGLPVCGRERAIIEDLALRGSRNGSVVLSLLSRGATLEGTESPALLIEEYRRARAPLTPGKSDAEGAQRLLRQRDDFIARRIDHTLKQGETGILFIGLLHDVLSRLPPSIDVTTAALRA